MLDKKTVINTAEHYANIVKNELSPSAIILYGSYAKGTASEDSDIDIAVIFNGFSGDWLKTSSKLWHLTRNVSLYIEPILLDSTDDPLGFVSEVMQTGHVIYQA